VGGKVRPPSTPEQRQVVDLGQVAQDIATAVYKAEFSRRAKMVAEVRAARDAERAIKEIAENPEVQQQVFELAAVVVEACIPLVVYDVMRDWGNLPSLTERQRQELLGAKPNRLVSILKKRAR